MTSFDLSPKIARRSRSSGESSCSPFGVILPTRISPPLTKAPTRTIPSSSRSRSFAEETFGISAVVLSGQSLVSRTSIVYSAIETCVKYSFSTISALRMMASSKLYPFQGIYATRRLRPRASSPFSIE